VECESLLCGLKRGIGPADVTTKLPVQRLNPSSSPEEALPAEKKINLHPKSIRRSPHPQQTEATAMPGPGAPTSPPTQKLGEKLIGQSQGQSASSRRPTTSLTALAAGGLGGGTLYAACLDDQLYARALGAEGEGADWELMGGAVGVVAMATLGDKSLYALDGTSRIWLRDL
jgi:hypothetical protein